MEQVWELLKDLGIVICIVVAAAAVCIILRIYLIHLVVNRVSRGERPCNFIPFSGIFLEQSQKRASDALGFITQKFQFIHAYNICVYKFSFWFLHPCFIGINNCTIFVQQKFIDSIDDEELRWLIAHEIGHVELDLGCDTDEMHMLVDRFAADKFGCEAGIRLMQKTDEIYGQRAEKTADGFTAINLEIEKRIQYLKSLRK